MRTTIGAIAMATLLCSGVGAGQVRADVIDDALALSKKTGRPILAIAGSDT